MEPMTLIAATMIGNAVGQVVALGYLTSGSIDTSVFPERTYETEAERKERRRVADDKKFASYLRSIGE